MSRSRSRSRRVWMGTRSMRVWMGSVDGECGWGVWMGSVFDTVTPARPSPTELFILIAPPTAPYYRTLSSRAH